MRYCLHGLSIEARADDPRLAIAVDGLFHRYEVQALVGARQKDSLTCVLETTVGLPSIIPAEAVSLHDVGRLRYSALGARLFVEAGQFATGIADLEARRITIYVARDWVDATWSIQHFAVLPFVLEFLRLRGIYPIHAAALEREGHALILPAMPGSGKSTLSIALLRAGMKLLSDDMPMLAGKGGEEEVLAFPEDINVCPDSVGFFEELAFLSEQMPNERNKHSFPADRLFPGCLAERAPPRLVVFPQIARTPCSLLEPMGKAEAVVALLQHSLPPLNRALARAHFETVMDTVSSCDCYRLHTGLDLAEAAAQLVDLLQRLC